MGKKKKTKRLFQPLNFAKFVKYFDEVRKLSEEISMFAELKGKCSEEKPSLTGNLLCTITPLLNHIESKVVFSKCNEKVNKIAGFLKRKYETQNGQVIAKDKSGFMLRGTSQTK